MGMFIYIDGKKKPIKKEGYLVYGEIREVPIERLIKESLKYKNWCLQVFERDNYTCQKCGAKNIHELQVHFTKQFFEILNKMKANCPPLYLYNEAMSNEILWDVNNGITLCKKCHEEIHEKENESNCSR
jgi:5-methylcytosine-specific restriction endonuclease McrA